MAIKPLNTHYSFENPASIYDEEAMTALELAGRQAAKINEVVNAQNTLKEETEQHLEQQDQLIDERMDSQDQAIETMNTVTMPAKVKQEMQARIADGTFGQEVYKSMGTLPERVDNLLENIPEGGTTMDAEVVDARQDHTGLTWANVGENFRLNMKLMSDCVFSLGDFQTNEVEPKEIKTGFYHKGTGGFYESAQYQSYLYDVEPGDVFALYNVIYGYDIADAILMRDGEIIKVYHTKSNGVSSNNGDKPIIVPPGMGGTLIVCTQSFNARIYKVAGFSANYEMAHGYINNMVEPLRNGTPILAEESAGEVFTGYILLNQEKYAITAGDAQYYLVSDYDVSAGESYQVSATAGYGNYFYVFYNETGNVLGSKKAPNEWSRINEVVHVPAGAVKLSVGGDASIPSIKKVVGYEHNAEYKWQHLKWVCMGDSLTELNHRTDKHYFDYVVEKTGINVVNMGLSGSGYMQRASEEQSFMDRIVNTPRDADVVTIFGSGNDLQHIANLGNPTDSNPGTLCGAINRTIDNLLAICPTVQLGIVAPTPWNGQTPDNDQCAMARYTAALEAICKRRGIPFLDLFHLSGYRPNSAEYRSLVFSKDPEGVANHPNELGHKIISGHFYNFLNSLIGTY